MRNSLNIALSIIVSVIATAAAAGPFGLHKGMTLQELRQHGNITQGKEPNLYSTSKLRNGHDTFEYYVFVVSPTSGLCKIVAGGKDIRSNSFGDQIRAAFKNLEEPLTKKYGTPSNQYDFLQSGSIWNDRNDWTMALYKEERTLSTFWKGNSLPDNLEVVMLSASAQSSSSGWISLQYQFDNATACLEEIKKKENNNL